MYVALPLSILSFGLLGVFTAGFSLVAWRQFFRQEAVLLTIAFLIVYNTAAGTLFEISENERFKFLIEPLLWVFGLVLISAHGAARFPEWAGSC